MADNIYVKMFNDGQSDQLSPLISIDFKMSLSVIVVPFFCHSAASKVNAQSSAPGPPGPLAAPPWHYPGGWQPPGAAAAPALPAAPEAARKAEALGHEMWELQRLRMPRGEDLMGF